MTDNKPGPDKKPAKPTSQTDREERQSAALRANLKKRKQQTHTQKSPQKDKNSD